MGLFEYFKQKKAAKRGDAQAQTYLGDLYYNGKIVSKSYMKAVEWYTKAAEQNNADAQYSLGGCFYRGEGVAQNYEKAVKWYTKAAEQNNAPAQCALGECFAHGEGIEQNYEKAVEWFVKKSFTKPQKVAGEVFDVTPEEAVDLIVAKLKEKFII